MLVFLTGASGFIGGAVIQDLQANGHSVLALARSDKTAEALKEAGVSEILEGDVENLQVLREGARKADAVIHLAFVLDFNDFERSVNIDLAAINAMGEVMQGTGKSLSIASGTLLAKGEPATEDTEPHRIPPFGVRAKSADAVFEWSKKGINGSVIRLSPTVHGKGDGGFITMLMAMAKQNGFVGIVDDGSARWPAVHRTDAATLFRLAIEKGKPGSVYNGVADTGVVWKDIAAAMSKKVDLPVKSMSLEEAVEKLQFFAYVISNDNYTSSEKTKMELDWTPKDLGLLEDIKQNYE